MQVAILGPLEVTARGGPVAVPGARDRALLALLAVSAGQVVTADRLVEELWGPDLPRDPANALQATVSRLRRALAPLGSEVVVTRPRGYMLQVPADSIDARRFERLVAEGRRRLGERPLEAAQQLGEALALWRGPALPELADTDTGRAEAARLEELRLAAEEERVDALLAAGYHADVVGEIDALVQAEPLRERRWRQLMLALYRSGRQVEALRTYQKARRVLGEELGLEPSPELRRLESAILAHDPSLGSPPVRSVPVDGVRHNLPARATTFVGRRRERRDVGKLLDEHRLLTLIGPGGVGKTSLAIEVAAERVDEHPGGVWLVELGAVAEGSGVMSAVAAALGVRERGGIGADGRPLGDLVVERVAATEPLLVLDSCEHVVEACAALASRLLATAPGVRILATSREPLNVAGEGQYAVPPLALPENAAPVEELAGSDAVRLFVERAAAVRPGFSLDAAGASAVAHVCRRLDGLPLAIELAAARIRALPVGELAARLDDRFRLLTSGRRDAPARQQTLRATLDWSYELLSVPEAALFRRLSVFTGSFGLSAAEAVGVDGDVHEDEVLHVLARLVDRSLVVFEPGADVRYRMLETVREYARGRLARTGEVEAVERRHAAYFLDVAEEVERLRRTKGGGGPALTRLEQEIDELRAAIDRSLAHGDTDVALRLGSALGWFWFAVSRGEGAGRLNAILAVAGDAPTLARAHALQAAALLEIWPLTDRALPRAAESLALCEQLGDRSGAALSKVILGAVGWSRSELAAEGACLLAEAEATFAEMNDGYHQAMAWRVQAFISVSQGELDRALELSRRSLAAFRELDEAWGISSALHQLGLILRLRRDYPGARQVLEEALDLSRQQGVWDNVHQVLHELGIVAALAGQHDRAAAYHEEAARLARLSGSRGPLARTYNGMGLAARLAGDFDRAAELHRQAAEVAREIDSTGELLWSLTSAGVIEELRGDLQAAEACHLEALQLAGRIAEPAAAALVLEGLAGVAVARDDAEQAAVLLGAAATGRTGAGVRFTRDVPDGERVVERARARLGEREFAQAFERGRALGVEAVARPLLDRVRELR